MKDLNGKIMRKHPEKNNSTHLIMTYQPLLILIRFLNKLKLTMKEKNE